jgi:predicted RNase H-like HicB family nuclease
VASKNEGTATVNEYVVIYEQGPTGWGAYCPDLPGLGVAAASRDEAERLIREGVQVHIDSLREHGDSVPVPTSAAGVVAVAAL